MFWKRCLQVGTIVFTGLVAVFFLQKLLVVTHDDVAGYYDLGRPQADFQVEGGSIYALSPDLTRSEWLCTTELKDAQVVQRDQNILFRNSLAAALPLVENLLNTVGFDLSEVDDVFRTELEFSGVYTKLLTNASGAQPEFCVKRMVFLAAQGYRVCRVRSTLVARGETVFAAFNFDSDQIYIPEETFASYGLERTDRIAQNGALLCPRAVPLPWEAKVRQKLKLVESSDRIQTSQMTHDG